MLKKVVLFSLGVSLCGGIGAQSIADSTNRSMDRYRPKVAEFSVEGLFDYNTSSSSENLNTAQNEVETDRLYKAKVAIPIVLKDDRAFGLQLKYSQHRFLFEEDEFQEDFGIYSHLNNTKFTSTGLRAFFQRDLSASDDLKIVGGAEIRSDELRWSRNTTKLFVSGIWSRQLSDRSKIGTGIVVNHEMRRTSLYPMFIYESQLAPNWHLALKLPKSVSLRRKINASNYIIGTAQLRGWRYNLTNSIEGENRDLTLRRADLEFSISWEHEIHDWLWFSLSAGYNKNLRYYLAEPGNPRRDALLNIQSMDARYVKASLFLVPPKKFYR